MRCEITMILNLDWHPVTSREQLSPDVPRENFECLRAEGRISKEQGGFRKGRHIKTYQESVMESVPSQDSTSPLDGIIALCTIVLKISI